jgi:hypothetical protein
MKNREIFVRDPLEARLANDGVASVREAATDNEVRTLRYELERFVCEGQYEDGLRRILETYLDNVNQQGSTTQRAAWVSGFYGSGKSHLLKMLRHLWVDTKFSDGATARGLASLPKSITDLLLELDNAGKRFGGLHAASGTLPSGGGESASLAVLSLIFASRGLPEALPQAQFCLWLRKEGLLERVKSKVEASGKGFHDELHDLYVSSLLGEAILEADPTFAPDLKQARAALRAQFPQAKDVSHTEFVSLAREVLGVDGKLPCTVLVLDEIQLFIGQDPDRSKAVQDLAEWICKELDKRVLLIGAGQTALAGNVPMLQRLKDRFTIPVELSDTDVETVTRRVVLAKRADRRKDIEKALANCAGEIDRQLSGTRIATRTEDRDTIVEDYPLLPVRRRFWEHVLRAVDVPGMSSQLRTQLKIVYEAARQTAEAPLGSVVPADFIFNQLHPDLVRTGLLLKEIDETIRSLDDGSETGRLASRLCGLIFLIRKLPRDTGVDIGVRATSETLADLLVSDLSNGGTQLRKQIPEILGRLTDKGTLIRLGSEYSLQTRESSEWEREFRNRLTRFNSDPSIPGSRRSDLIARVCAETLRSTKLTQGKGKVPRDLRVVLGGEAPAPGGSDVAVWIRDGWGEKETVVANDARAAGTSSATVFIFIPKANAEELQREIATYDAANATLDFKGTPSADDKEACEARDSMATRRNAAADSRDRIAREVVNGARVLQGGGTERFEDGFAAKVGAAANAALDRLFPEFRHADDGRWPSVITRARSGDGDALAALDWTEAPDKHPVCAALLGSMGAGKAGKDVRDTFEASPYGWPRDAVDAALIVLHTIGHIRARHKGTDLSIGQLDQAKISVTDFRLEVATLTAKDKIALRKLFQKADLSCKSGEEAAKAPGFLARLTDLAQGAGGDTPLPARPATTHIEKLRGLAQGNEQLVAILEQREQLEQQSAEWGRLAQLAAARMPEWETVSALLAHAADIEEAAPARDQAEAVRKERRLLSPENPVPDIAKGVASVLRGKLNAASEEFAKAYAEGMASLQASEAWKKLKPAQRKEVLAREAIQDVDRIAVGTDAELLASLSRTSLGAWHDKADALGAQFARVALAAARLVEPEAQQLKLDRATLRTEEEAEAWWAKTKRSILERLKKGPVVLE